jgi:hypothetical protein
MSLGTGNIVNKVLSAVGTHVTTRMKALCPGLAEDADVSGAFEVSIAAGFTNVFSDSADAAAKVSKVKAFCAGGVGSDFDPASWFDLAQVRFLSTYPRPLRPFHRTSLWYERPVPRGVVRWAVHPYCTCACKLFRTRVSVHAVRQWMSCWRGLSL